MKSVGIVLATVAVIALIAFGIGQARPLGAAASPSESASAKASQTADPSTSAEPSVTSPGPSMTPRPGTPILAAKEVDGIRVTLELDRDRVAYGERAWATVTVLNTGQDDVHWGHSGTCDFAASVSVISSGPLDLGHGRDWTGELGVLKLVTLTNQDEMTAPGGAVGGFAPESWVDAATNMGCTSDFVPDVILPGATETYRAAWDADGIHDLPVPPGNYQAAAVFSYLKRGSPPDDEFTGPIRLIAVEVPILVDSRGVDYLGPGEALDRVFASQAFLDKFESAPRERWTGCTLHFRDGAWVMSLYLEDPGEAIVVTVDGRSGEITDVVLDEDPPPAVH